MNRIELFNYPRFPLSAETIDFLQQMSVMMAKAAGIGGDNYILTGCAESGVNIGSGIIVVAGEVMPFVGGTKESFIVIEEVKRSVTAEGQVYANIYVSRQARFGTGANQIAWSLFERVITIPELQAQIAAVLPAGMIVMWGGEVVPNGWALCDGENGTPDLRDRFIVGAGSDYAVGDSGGTQEVYLTEEQMPSHRHGSGDLDINSPTVVDLLNYNNNTLSLANSISKGVTTKTLQIEGQTGYAGNGDAIDIRPPYYALAFIIKL